MTKTKKLKISLILLSIVTAAILLFTTQASYASDTNDNGVDRGFVTTSVSDKIEFFDSIEKLEVICMDHFESENYLEIHLLKDFDFNNRGLTIDNGRTFKFIFNGHFLWSSEGLTMLNVENGNLILSGEKDNLGKFQEPGDDPAIKVGELGQVQGDNIWFLSNKEHMSLPSHGGLVYFDDITKDSCFNNCIFDGKAKNGGAIYVNDVNKAQTKVTFNKCEFSYCHATSDGGAVCDTSKNSNLEFNDTTFDSCSSEGNGGAIATQNDTEEVVFNNCNINNCSSVEEGGAIYNDSNKSKYTLDHTTIFSCHADEYGGAISSHGDNVNYYFNHTTIDSCSTDHQGGAIYCWSTHACFYGQTGESVDKLTPYSALANTTTIKNCYGYGGDAFYSSDTSGRGNHITVSHINFVDNGNEKYRFDSCLYVRGDKNVFQGCHFMGNLKHTHVIFNTEETCFIELDRDNYMEDCEFDEAITANKHIVSLEHGNYLHCSIGHTSQVYYKEDNFDFGNYFWSKTYTDWKTLFTPVHLDYQGPVTILGQCYDSGKKLPIKGIKVQLLDKDDKVIATTTSDDNGMYSFDFKSNLAKNVKVRATYEGETYTSESFDMDKATIHKNICFYHQYK